MTALPAITTKARLAAWKRGLIGARTFGLAGVFAPQLRALEFAPYNEDDLRIVLHNKLAISSMAKQRAGSVLGRVWNRMSGENPDYVELSAVHLRQVLEVVQRPVPEGWSNGSVYLLRADIARQAHQAIMYKQRDNDV